MKNSSKAVKKSPASVLPALMKRHPALSEHIDNISVIAEYVGQRDTIVKAIISFVNEYNDLDILDDVYSEVHEILGLNSEEGN